MSFKEWINNIIKEGHLCESYEQKVKSSSTKLSLMRLCLDANGASYLCEMDSLGYQLPYETILKEFGNYINGRYIAAFHNENGNGYTSTLYCCYTDDSKINIETTLTTILGCKSDLYIKENDFVKIYADRNCELTIHCPKSARCIINYWNGAKIVVKDSDNNVELERLE